jgi:hypothetical protein
MRHAVIIDGIVANVVIWDGSTPWEPPAGAQLVALAEGEFCSARMAYDPAAHPRFAPTAEELPAPE